MKTRLPLWGWILLATAVLLSQTTRPRPGSSSPSVAPYLRWGGGASVPNNCLKLDASGAAVDSGGPCSVPSGNIVYYDGARPPGNCVKWDAEGRAIDAGFPCGSGTGSSQEGQPFGNFVNGETPSGAINGANTIFTTANLPNANTLQVFRNGVYQTPGTSYTATGSTITMATAPQVGDAIRVVYQWGTFGLGQIVDEETPTGAINGTNATFTTAVHPIAGSLKVYLNGIRMRSAVDYTFTAPNTITFINGVAPQPSDILTVEYRY